MFFEHHLNNIDTIRMYIQDQDPNVLLVTYINGLKSKYIMAKKEAYRLKNILENK